jgi:hypothetical protein
MPVALALGHAALARSRLNLLVIQQQVVRILIRETKLTVVQLQRLRVAL